MAFPAHLRFRLHSGAAPDTIARLVSDALRASPALAGMRKPLTNTFDLYVNGALGTTIGMFLRSADRSYGGASVRLKTLGSVPPGRNN